MVVCSIKSLRTSIGRMVVFTPCTFLTIRDNLSPAARAGSAYRLVLGLGAGLWHGDLVEMSSPEGMEAEVLACGA
jgi:hypothetical protein